ncbi:MAG TPA: DUF2470 domain-containing protein [Bryobacterales bacterium]|nr:DUF2470 domain-containing protein [Bryobacterales bacterium]
MANESQGRHASGGEASEGPPVPEPTYAERARTLVHLGRVGSLSTLSRKQPGWPFGSVMPYALDPQGRPIVLISTMAMHTQNLLGDPRASLLVTQDTGGDVLGAGRVTLLGKAAEVSEPGRLSVRQLYLARHENARYWVDFDDFAFYRMDVVDVYFVGGFGVMGWVAAEHYLAAEVDPLAGAAPEIIRHMNADHADSLLLLSRVFAGVEASEAQVTAVDRLGFHLRLKTGDRARGARVAFTREARSPREARAVLVEMVKLARQKLS